MRPRRRPPAPALPPATVADGLPALHSAEFIAAVDAAVTAQSNPRVLPRPWEVLRDAYTGRTAEQHADAFAAGEPPSEALLALTFYASARERLHRAEDPAGTAGASPERVAWRWTAFRPPYDAERTT
ncbi:hypothetical protein ACUN7V_02420 [Quadrisphaera oryzae]|uniref:hypothetical protein n=1 Tax=Quadrisphaera TaxID=317661 RepID=UPI001646E5C5|nr:hypothetical protein [Quadrisphaera sp. RL12-1S]MBC3761077.1 hypothetical protein [Quadrisphaera sp. RL12-1S]